MHIPAALSLRPDVLSATVHLDGPDADAPPAWPEQPAVEDARARGCSCAQAPFVAWQLCPE